uniref:BRCT domain-containing protein n=1 Tax=Eucampia antarctica TaxID=49252 RepID=A0A7S2RHK8_9STRA
MDRISLLLRSCGVTIVSDLNSVKETISTKSNSSTNGDDTDNGNKKTSPDDAPKVLIVIRPNAQTRDHRRAEKFLLAQKQTNLPIIKSDWLLDSIAEFTVKPIENYYTKSS